MMLREGVQGGSSQAGVGEMLIGPRERKRTRKIPTGCNCTNSKCDRHNHKTLLNNSNGVNKDIVANPHIPPKLAENVDCIDMTTERGESVAAAIIEKKQKEKEFLKNVPAEMREFLQNIPAIMRDEVLMQMMVEKVCVFMLTYNLIFLRNVYSLVYIYHLTVDTRIILLSVPPY
jgi:hypothetical protein